ncbi:restriction endonuclease subunit S, partial [uncultured Varibaculum sp.]|uniref:restriction endonuclease subunit S n=1 Tax=uncultured Varibaculum sp. TaxID=413896 RepID=UPI00258E0E87
EKHRLISEGKTKFPRGGESIIYIGSDGCHYEKHIDKKGKVISETGIQDQIPFEIPNTWTWARFTTLTVQVGNKNNQVKSKDIAEYGDYPVISQSSIRYIDGYCAASQARPIKSVPVLLFGDHTRAVKFIDHPFVIGADGTKCHNAIVCNPYFLYILMEYFVYKIRNRGYGRHHALLKNEIMPLPPLPEQQRIVERVKELLAIITSQ